MKKSIRVNITLLAFALALSACFQAEQATKPQDENTSAGQPLPDVSDYSASSEEPSETFLSKTALLVKRPQTVKDFDFGFRFAFRRIVRVPHRGTVEASAEDVTGANPIIAAYYGTSSDAASMAYPVTFVAVDDELWSDGPRNARIVWRNLTGVTRDVHILVFAAAMTWTGNVDIKINDPINGLQTYRNVPITAFPDYMHTRPGPFAGCAAQPFGTSIRLTRVSGGGYRSGILAFNKSTMTGGFIQESGLSNQDQTLQLQSVLPNSDLGGSFVMGVMLAPSVPAMEETWFRGRQQDAYLCD